MDWYVSVFIGSTNGRPNYARVKSLDLVRQQANDFKHDHTTVQLRRMRTMNAALDAFSHLLDLLDLTIEDHDTLVTRQTQSQWWKKNVLQRWLELYLIPPHTITPAQFSDWTRHPAAPVHGSAGCTHGIADRRGSAYFLWLATHWCIICRPAERVQNECCFSYVYSYE